MATIIVKHRRTGNEYILLGINGELDKVNPSRFISELFNQEKSEVACSATVCDVQGNIFLAYIDDLTVLEIDGKKLTDILPEATFESVNNDVYAQQPNEFFADEELEDEVFDGENGEQSADKPKIASTYDQDPSQQDDLGKEEEDWI